MKKMKKIAYKKMFEFEDKHFWFVAREKICQSLIDDIIYNSSVGRILDYGCGTGKLVEKLQKLYQNKEIYGVDIFNKVLSIAQKRKIANIIDLKKRHPPKNYFDLILCLDVLEHVKDDLALLRHLKTLLRKNGKLLLTVPAYNFLWSGEDYVSNHIRRYTRVKLKKKISQSGFRIKKISYFNTFLFFPLIAVLLTKRIFQPRTMYLSDIQNIPESLNKILTRIFVSEKYFLKFASFPFGASIIVVAENLKTENEKLGI